VMKRRENIVEELICLGLKLNCFDSQNHEGRALVLMERILMFAVSPAKCSVVVVMIELCVEF